jgi:hypothetical protein
VASLECCDGVEVRAEERGKARDDNDKFQDDVRPSLTLGLGAGLASSGGLSCIGDISQ